MTELNVLTKWFQCADVIKRNHFSQRITASLCKEATLLGLTINLWEQTDHFFYVTRYNRGGSVDHHR